MTPSAFGNAAGGSAGRSIGPMVVEEVITFGRVVNVIVRDGVKRAVRQLGDIVVVTEGLNLAPEIVVTVMIVTR